MAKRRDLIAEELRELADDLESLWRTATRDPKKEARRERTWTILSGALAAASTMAARQLLARLWPILTGERPPLGGGIPSKPPAEERPREPTRV